MDVGNPSNFVRLIRFFGDDWAQVKEMVSGCYFDDDQTKATMREVFDETGYVLCPHTAVAYRGLQEYRHASRKDFTGIFLATAHPAKFRDLVEETLEQLISVPDRLKYLLTLEKKSIRMKADFNEFKSFLMK
jgi:threonine synthase